MNSSKKIALQAQGDDGAANNTSWTSRLENLTSLIAAYDDKAADVLCLVASGTSVSQRVRSLMDTDLLNRAAEGSQDEAVFPGLENYYEIERVGEADVAAAFGADFAELRPISGSQANHILLASLTKTGDVIMSPSMRGGAHISMAGRVTRSLKDYTYHYLPLRQRSFAIDIEAACADIKKYRPGLIFLGGSVVIEEQDFTELAMTARETGTITIYDASHVAGLIACGAFRNPLKDGIDLMTMTTCKTLPGPSHAWIVGSKEYHERIKKAVFPGFVSGGHLQEYVGALAAFYEMMAVRKVYGNYVISSARLLGSTLENCGFNIVKTSKGEITDTHQVLCESHNIFNADEITKRLASNGILCNANHLPRTNGFTSEEGIRFGTQEVTWQGMQPTQAVDVGHLIHDILASPNEGPSYRHRVKNLRHSFKKNILSNVG